MAACSVTAAKINSTWNEVKDPFSFDLAVNSNLSSLTGDVCLVEFKNIYMLMHLV